MSSEKQTLILAGESVPQRDPANRRPITIVATPVDDPNSYSGANAYTRTQELSQGEGRKIIIDAYA